MKKVNRITTYLVILFIITSINTIYAQWDFNLSANQEYSSNPFRTPESSPDMVSSFLGGLRNNLGSLKLLYYGAYTGYSQFTERNNYWHQLGFYRDDTNYILGVYGEQRVNKSDYSFFNYYSLTGYYKSVMDNSFMNTILNFSGSVKHYSELPEYNNVFLNSGVNLNKSLPSKTSLILNTGLNYKYYTGTQNSTTQFYANFRVAQSLFESTGIATYYTNRTLISGGGALNSDYNLYYGDESDLYDDPVSRNENALGFEFTQLLPSEITLKTGYEYSSRLYPSQGIYTDVETYNDLNEREDIQSFLFLKASKSISLSEENHYKLNLGISASYYYKSSNSYWYDFAGNDVSIILGLEF